MAVSLDLLYLLGGLAADIRTKENGIQTNQMSALLLNERPRTIAETIATATELLKFS